MKPKRGSELDASVDELFAELLRGGEGLAPAREFMARASLDEATLITLLRRSVTVGLLEYVGTTPPWADHPRVLGAVLLNPKAPRALGLRLVPYLFWRDLSQVAASPWVSAAVRVRAEGVLREKLPEMRLGERVTLARIATPPVLIALLFDAELKVVGAALQNPRLREEDLLVQLRSDSVSPALIQAVAASSRWVEHYAVRLGLALQARTPLGVALGQISSLLPADLRRVAETSGLHPLVQASARRVADQGSEGRNLGRSAR